LRVNYSHLLTDINYPYCIGACLNVTRVDSANSDLSYNVLTPALSATHYAIRGLSQAGTSLHVTEVSRDHDSLLQYRRRRRKTMTRILRTLNISKNNTFKKMPTRFKTKFSDD